ncbi:MAG: BppU family phage baseplate upper protein [Clostridiaceae bacterium]|nr:BppU family phage baseplate upper protein [Clostridiaceae bacterium]
MIKRTFDITARIEQGQIPFCFQCVQNDKDVYVLHIRITDGGQEIDYGEISDATITFALANGSVVQSDPERLSVSSAGITYQMGTSEIACPGKVLASIQLFGSNGERLTTARFQFEVVADLITPGAVQSESRFPILQQLVADVEQLKQDIVELQIPDNSIMDTKLSDAAGQIKARLAELLDDFTSLSGQFDTHKGDNSHVPHLGTTTNSSNAYTVTTTRTISDGQKFSVKFNVAASGPATLKISTDSVARLLKKPGGSDFVPKAGIYSFIRDGSNFQCLGEGGEIPKLPNLIYNGSFENDFDRWIYTGHISVNEIGPYHGAKSVFVNNQNGSVVWTAANQAIKCNTGDKIYCTAMVYANATEPVTGDSLFIRAVDMAITQELSRSFFNVSLVDSWQRVSCIATAVDDGIRIEVASYAPVQGVADCVMAINLTEAFGAGNEPSIVDIDDMVKNHGSWWDHTTDKKYARGSGTSTSSTFSVRGLQFAPETVRVILQNTFKYTAVKSWNPTSADLFQGEGSKSITFYDDGFAIESYNGEIITLWEAIEA